MHKTQDRTFNDSKYDSFVNKQKSKPKTKNEKQQLNIIRKKNCTETQKTYKIKNIVCSKTSNH
jgi:hypothetical protein